MKKAPKRYNNGGSIEGDPKKKKQASVLTPNANFPTPQEQQGFNKSTIPKDIDRTYTNTGGGTSYNAPLSQAGQQVGSGRKVEIMNTGGKKITNPDGSIEYYGSDGKPLPVMGKAKGGTVKKMTKAPCRMKKGGTC